MLEYIFDIKSLPFMEICQVYEQSLACGLEHENSGETARYWKEENDLYLQLQDFFANRDSRMAVWRTVDGIQAALRLEHHRDGLLLFALETRPDSRRKGFASSLVEQVLADLDAGEIIYSHVRKDNSASMQLHFKCGFTVHSDVGRLLDGSVSNAYVTLKYIKK